MKKFIASAGLAALGATGLQAAYAPGLSPMETSKPWSIAASVRGFYDDNYNQANKDSGLKKSSFGAEFSPSAAINIPLDQTYIGASYIYTLRYYDDRPNNKVDHTHEFTAKLNHKFSEIYKLDFEDAFAYSQEPEIIQGAGTAQSTFLRTDSSAIRNRLRGDFTAQVTELLAIQPGYQLTWYDYLDSGPGSRSALLNRLEHQFHIDGVYHLQEHLDALAGYEYDINDYTSSESIDPTGTFFNVPGNIRGNESHKLYGGANYALSSQLNGSARAGVQITTYDDKRVGDTETSPYIELLGTYTYALNSYAQLGVRHTRNATDVGITSAGVTRDQESTMVFGSVRHRVSQEVTANLLGQYQYGEFSGGTFDGKIEHFLGLGVNLEYRINPNWAVDAGYNFDRLDSDIGGRSFTRNRIFLGASATF